MLSYHSFHLKSCIDLIFKSSLLFGQSRPIYIIRMYRRQNDEILILYHALQTWQILILSMLSTSTMLWFWSPWWYSSWAAHRDAEVMQSPLLYLRHRRTVIAVLTKSNANHISSAVPYGHTFSLCYQDLRRKSDRAWVVRIDSNPTAWIFSQPNQVFDHDTLIDVLWQTSDVLWKTWPHASIAYLRLQMSYGRLDSYI